MKKSNDSKKNFFVEKKCNFSKMKNSKFVCINFKTLRLFKEFLENLQILMRVGFAAPSAPEPNNSPSITKESQERFQRNFTAIAPRKWCKVCVLREG